MRKFGVALKNNQLIDYDFIRKLLREIVESETFYIEVDDLFNNLAKKFAEEDVDHFENIFYKSLFLTRDCGLIEEMAGKDLGFRVDIAKNVTKKDCIIRLTADGYLFYENLSKNGFMQKIKDLSLYVGVEMCKASAAKLVDDLID
mgnify:CR=1 FL=1